MSLRVAVVVVGYRNPGDVLRCLAALEASTYADFQVLICENGGENAYQRLCSLSPSELTGGRPVRIFLAPRNLGYGGGVNLCIGQAPDVDAWWILNPDTEPEPAALGALAKRLADGDCDAVGATIYRPNGLVQSYGGRWLRCLARAESVGIDRALTARVDVASIERRQTYLNGAAMLVSRQFLARAGPLREDYFLYCEEVEWCIRATREGLRLGFAAGAKILHAQGTTTGARETFRSWPRLPVYLNERNRLLLTRDCFSALYPVAVMGALVVLILRYIKARAWRQLGFALAGWRAGLRNERGAPPWAAT